MGKDDDTIAGIILGILGLAAIAAIIPKKCPVCSNSVQRGSSICPHCWSKN